MEGEITLQNEVDLSGSPSPETHPLNPYSRDGWNLNNMPILPESYVILNVQRLMRDYSASSGQTYPG